MNNIIERGQWVESYESNFWGWNINNSSILTKLIQLTGRYVDDWASDIYIFWRFHVDNLELMRDKNWNTTWYIGFRKQGVDWSDEPWERENKVFDFYKENDNYYRRIVKLKIRPGENKGWIEFELSEVA